MHCYRTKGKLRRHTRPVNCGYVVVFVDTGAQTAGEVILPHFPDCDGYVISDISRHSVPNSIFHFFSNFHDGKDSLFMSHSRLPMPFSSFPRTIQSCIQYVYSCKLTADDSILYYDDITEHDTVMEWSTSHRFSCSFSTFPFFKNIAKIISKISYIKQLKSYSH